MDSSYKSQVIIIGFHVVSYKSKVIIIGFQVVSFLVGHFDGLLPPLKSVNILAPKRPKRPPRATQDILRIY